MMLFAEKEMRPYWPFEDLSGPYDLIMADPPWKFLVRSEKGLGKSPDRHYATMDLEEVALLPVADLAADNCLLWMWVTAPMLPMQLEIIERWGFSYKTNGVWVKTTISGGPAFGPGYLLRNAHENFVIATRGNCERVTNVRSVIMAKRREHSRKPDEAYDAAEMMRPGIDNPRRLDLFSRQSRPGWDAWGNETGKFKGGSDAG